MDARNSQVYTALYSCVKGTCENISGYMGITVSELAGIIRGKNRHVVFVGDGVPLYHEFFKQELGQSCSFATGGHMLQRASSVAALAAQKAASGKLESSFDLVPFYLRKSQADRITSYNVCYTKLLR